jgi:hypothetical protein
MKRPNLTNTLTEKDWVLLRAVRLLAKSNAAHSHEMAHICVWVLNKYGGFLLFDAGQAIGEEERRTANDNSL